MSDMCVFAECLRILVYLCDDTKERIMLATLRHFNSQILDHLTCSEDQCRFLHVYYKILNTIWHCENPTTCTCTVHMGMYTYMYTHA